jgi:RNA polymerase sigma-70 factor (ECF subfamily)
VSEPDSDSKDDPLLASVKPDELPDVTESMRLLDRAQHGDDGALNDLLRRYEDRLKRIVRIRLSAKLRRCVETVDIVQETYQSALKHIGDLEMRSTASIMQWLSRIAENQMHDVHRRFYGQKRDRSREVRLADGGRLNDDSTPGVVASTGEMPPDEQVAQDEIRKIVDDAVAELPDDYREVIMLRTYYGGSWEFVAQQIGRPNADAARQLHRRARIRLSRIMQGRLPEPE